MACFAYAVSGFFLYLVNLLLLFRLPEGAGYIRWIMELVFLTPAVIFWLVGAALRGRSRLRYDTGVLLLATGLWDAFMGLTLGCMFATPQVQVLFTPEMRMAWSGFGAAGACLALYLALGALLFFPGRARAR